MKQQVKPNGFLDFLSPEEFIKHSEDQTQAILAAFGKNAAFRRIINAAAIDGAGNFSLDIPVADGFVWDVRAYSVFSVANTGKASGLYINDASTKLNQVASQTVGNNWATIPAKTCIVHSGEKLVVANGNAFVTPDNVSVLVTAVEVPISHMADLLL